MQKHTANDRALFLFRVISLSFILGLWVGGWFVNYLRDLP